VLLMWCYDHAPTHICDLNRPMPDVRLLNPCRWQALPAHVRAEVRAQFTRSLEDKFGPEIGEGRFYVNGLPF